MTIGSSREPTLGTTTDGEVPMCTRDITAKDDDESEITAGALPKDFSSFVGAVAEDFFGEESRGYISAIL